MISIVIKNIPKYIVYSYLKNFNFNGEFIRELLNNIPKEAVIEFLDETSYSLDIYYYLGLTKEEIINDPVLFSLVVSKFVIKIKNEEVLGLIYKNQLDKEFLNSMDLYINNNYIELKKELLKIICENSNYIPEEDLDTLLKEYPLLEEIIPLTTAIKNIDLAATIMEVTEQYLDTVDTTGGIKAIWPQ